MSPRGFSGNCDRDGADRRRCRARETARFREIVYLLDDEAAPPEPLDAAEPEPPLPLLLDAAPPPLPLPDVLPVVLPELEPELDVDEDDLLALPVPPGATTVSRCSEHADSAKAPAIRNT
jgi:hypothetical protein